MAARDFIAEVQLSHPRLALAPTIRQLPDVSIELDYQIIADPGTYYLFFEVEGHEFGAFDAAVAEDETVADSTVIIEGDDFRVYRMRLLDLDRLVLPTAAELGMRILYAEAGGAGWRAKLEVPDLGLLREFREHCTDREVAFTMRKIYEREDEAGGEFGLTPAQREVLVVARRAGYFEEPRDASLQDVADALGISQSAASGRLRRAVSRLVATTVAEESAD